MKKVNNEIMDKLISSSYLTVNENNVDMNLKIEEILKFLEAFEKEEFSMEYRMENSTPSFRKDVEIKGLGIEETTSMTDNVKEGLFVLKEEK